MLGDAVAAALPEMRAHAESMMTATFDVFRPDGTTVVNGFKVPSYTKVDVVCGKVQGGSSSTKDPSARRVAVGGVERPETEAGLHLPIGAEPPIAGDRGVGWEYQCTAVSCPEDGYLVGKRYLVVSVPTKSFATARRLNVIEVPAPEEP